jgi:hypothetical protein
MWDKLFFYDFDRNRLIVNPEMPRALHCDLALNSKGGDALGISVGHICGFKEKREFIPQKGDYIIIKEPIIYIDFMLRVISEKTQIDLSKIRDFIISLSRTGMVFSHVTFDQALSGQILQDLMKEGFPASKISVDRDDTPYTTLMYTINENRLRMYRYEWFIREVTNLFHDRKNRKVDHPAGGSKDVADAVCGVVHNLTLEANQGMQPFQAALPPKNPNTEGVLPTNIPLVDMYDSERQITHVTDLDLTDNTGF